jgi:hypothetical protein
MGERCRGQAWESRDPARSRAGNGGDGGQGRGWAQDRGDRVSHAPNMAKGLEEDIARLFPATASRCNLIRHRNTRWLRASNEHEKPSLPHTPSALNYVTNTGEYYMSASDQALPIRKRYKLMKWLSPFIALLPLSLETVLRMSGSDKERQGVHHYGPTYQRLFYRMKYQHLTLLEIGIGGYDKLAGGESLAAWRCYFPFGKIVGCDIQDKRQLGGGRVHIRVLDQSSATDLARLAAQDGPFDIIIDDGSHVNMHQIFSFENLFPHVNEGGIYVIEDTQTSYWPQYGGKPVDQQTLSTAMGYFTELAKYLNWTEFRTKEGDADMINLAKTITSIYFEHNLIIVTAR